MSPRQFLASDKQVYKGLDISSQSIIYLWAVFVLELHIGLAQTFSELHYSLKFS